MEYGRRYNENRTPKDMQQVIGEFESRVSDRINELDQTVRDLLQIVSILTILTMLSELTLRRNLPGSH